VRPGARWVRSGLRWPGHAGACEVVCASGVRRLCHGQEPTEAAGPRHKRARARGGWVRNGLRCPPLVVVRCTAALLIQRIWGPFFGCCSAVSGLRKALGSRGPTKGARSTPLSRRPELGHSAVPLRTPNWPLSGWLLGIQEEGQDEAHLAGGGAGHCVCESMPPGRRRGLLQP
jgi:hypothetical protein